MNWRDRRKMFLAALEVWTLAHDTPPSGSGRKLAELSRFLDHGGELQPGVLFVQSQRSGNMNWFDWATDFLACLPKNQRQRRLILKTYSDALLTAQEVRHTRGPLWLFWSDVNAKGLSKPGAVIVRQLRAR